MQVDLTVEEDMSLAEHLGDIAPGTLRSREAADLISRIGRERAAQDAHANLLQRYLWFILGVAINSFGVAFITKAALGTSPVSSVPYVLDLAFPPTLGEFTFVLNTLYVLMQVAMLRRDFKPIQLLQLAVNVVFSALIDVSMGFLGWLNPTTLPLQLVSLVAGCAILALGIAIEVAPNVLVVPGEGLVRTISGVTENPFGTCKVAFDVTLVAIAVVLSFIFFGRLNGLGLGTIVSALAVGRLCNLYNLHLPLIAAIARLTRGRYGAPREAL